MSRVQGLVEDSGWGGGLKFRDRGSLKIRDWSPMLRVWVDYLASDDDNAGAEGLERLIEHSDGRALDF